MIRNSIYGVQFDDPDEQQLATLGKGFASGDTLSVENNQPGATLTNKRVYFSGKIYNFAGKGLVITKQRRTFELHDITQMSYYTFRPIHFALIGIALLAIGLYFLIDGIGRYGFMFQFGAVGVVFGIVLLVVYLGEKKKLLLVVHKDGKLAFDEKWFLRDKLKDFINDFNQAKKALEDR